MTQFNEQTHFDSLFPPDFQYLPSKVAMDSFPLTDQLKALVLSPTEDFINEKIKFLQEIENKMFKNEPPSKNHIDYNEVSLAFKLSFGDTNILISGDAQESQWLAVLPQCDEGTTLESHIIQVSHHGSKIGNPPQLWQSICLKDKESIAVIAGGKIGQTSYDVIKLILQHGKLYCINKTAHCTEDNESDLLDPEIASANYFGKKTLDICSGQITFTIDKKGTVKLKDCERDFDCIH